MNDEPAPVLVVAIEVGEPQLADLDRNHDGAGRLVRHWA